MLLLHEHFPRAYSFNLAVELHFNQANNQHILQVRNDFREVGRSHFCCTDIEPTTERGTWRLNKLTKQTARCVI